MQSRSFSSLSSAARLAATVPNSRSSYASSSSRLRLSRACSLDACTSSLRRNASNSSWPAACKRCSTSASRVGMSPCPSASRACKAWSCAASSRNRKRKSSTLCRAGTKPFPLRPSSSRPPASTALSPCAAVPRRPRNALSASSKAASRARSSLPRTCASSPARLAALPAACCPAAEAYARAGVEFSPAAVSAGHGPRGKYASSISLPEYDTLKASHRRCGCRCTAAARSGLVHPDQAKRQQACRHHQVRRAGGQTSS
mmetsp:Transcript_37985/g.104437  ORF Transcript_37985/g.104437 Transcript_37985/m.104437 type:complete len:258 (+) Transcript_37985:1257-2030(+)